jgi:signal transduction histidine kinase
MKEVADGFNSLASELEHTELVRSDFINNFSHEFKTPLSSMKGLIVLLKSGRVSKEKQKEYLEIIEDEADRLSMMTTNILNLSKIQNQKIVINKEKYNLSEQMRSCLVLFEKRWREKALSMSVDIGKEEETVAAEELMRQVWVNLIDNAIKFSYDGTEVEISVKGDEQNLFVSVANRGDCISSEERESIFHKFYQGDTSVARSGNGIGLSIVKSIVDMHSGKIEVESEDSKTTFTVALPRN